MSDRKLDYETFWGGDLILEDAKEAAKRWNAYPLLVQKIKAILNVDEGPGLLPEALREAEILLNSLNES